MNWLALLVKGFGLLVFLYLGVWYIGLGEAAEREADRQRGTRAKVGPAHPLASPTLQDCRDCPEGTQCEACPHRRRKLNMDAYDQENLKRENERLKKTVSRLEQRAHSLVEKMRERARELRETGLGTTARGYQEAAHMAETHLLQLDLPLDEEGK